MGIICFTSKLCQEDIVRFKDFCDLLLHNKFFEDKVDKGCSESEKAVRQVGRLLLAEIRESQYD